MFFILSAGRSGSRTIAWALDRYRNCACYHHPEPEFVLEATQYFYGEYSGDKIAEVLCSTRPTDSKKRVYGEANLQLSFLVPVIEHVFPTAKYIWLLRDGRDVVASMYYRRYFDPEDQKVPPIWQNAWPQGNRTGDFSSSEWRKMSRFARCCWLWKKYNLVIESHLQKLDQSRWMSVRLDQLKVMMPKIAQFLGLHGNRRVLVEKQNVAFQPVTYWDGWNDEMRDTFELHCGDVMDRYFPEWRTDEGIWQKIDAETPDEAGLLLQAKRRLAGLFLFTRMKARGLKRRISVLCDRCIDNGNKVGLFWRKKR